MKQDDKTRVQYRYIMHVTKKCPTPTTAYSSPTPLTMMAFLNSFQLVPPASHHGPLVGTEASNIQTKKDDTTRVHIFILYNKVGSWFPRKITKSVFDSLKEMNRSTNPLSMCTTIFFLFSLVLHNY